MLYGAMDKRRDELLPLSGHSGTGAGFVTLSNQNGIGASLSLVMKSILGSPDSRKIFIYLCINFGFMFVELIYGFWTNSLGSASLK
jgi:zinc transporter 5/7